MAFRRPLYSTDGDLREMTDSMIEQVREHMAQSYLADPSVNINVLGSGGNMGQMIDTRLRAGNYVGNARRFPTEAETPEPGIVSIGYTRMHQVKFGETGDDSNRIRFPVFNNNGDVQAMTLTDMLDTFAIPALATVSNTSVYTIHTSTSLSGYNLVSSTPVFEDTRAASWEYWSGRIPDTLDRPTLIGQYWLFKYASTGVPSSGTSPLFISDSTGGALTARSDAQLNALYRDVMHIAGIRNISYSINGPGRTCGAAMVDTRLNGAGNYQVRFVNRNDYRAQEFPNGSPIAISTYLLRQNTIL